VLLFWFYVIIESTLLGQLGVCCSQNRIWNKIQGTLYLFFFSEGNNGLQLLCFKILCRKKEGGGREGAGRERGREGGRKVATIVWSVFTRPVTWLILQSPPAPFVFLLFWSLPHPLLLLPFIMSWEPWAVLSCQYWMCCVTSAKVKSEEILNFSFFWPNLINLSFLPVHIFGV